MGSELFLGYNQFTGGLSNHFTNRVMGGFAFDISYKKFTVSTRINFSGTKTLQEITRRDITWPKDVNGYMIGADLRVSLPGIPKQERVDLPCRRHRWDGDRPRSSR